MAGRRRPRLHRARGRGASAQTAQGQAGAERRRCATRPRAAARPAEGDHVAVIGDNRKMVLFPLDQVPEMTRGHGVRLQKYKDGGLSDVNTFTPRKA
ncbi:MAG: hypothetical protein MZV49_02655 [Rhodopseudomonas palustris]|nr:hypothetical protein [Rhodopseudomonas palustris]